MPGRTIGGDQLVCRMSRTNHETRNADASVTDAISMARSNDIFRETDASFPQNGHL